MELFEALGLDIRILLAQFINFAVLVFVLYRFAYKPIFEILEKRRKSIENGVRQSQEAEKRLEDAKKKSKDIVKEAKKEAKEIVEEAQHKARKRKEEIMRDAQVEIQEMMSRHKEEMSQEKERIIEDVKMDIARLIVIGVERVSNVRVSEKEASHFMEKALEEFTPKSK